MATLSLLFFSSVGLWIYVLIIRPLSWDAQTYFSPSNNFGRDILLSTSLVFVFGFMLLGYSLTLIER